MTRYRVPFSGLTILAVAMSAAFDAHGQAKSSANARLINGTFVSSCSGGYSLTIAADGSLDVTCTTVSATPSPSPTPSPTPSPAPTTPTPSAITSPANGSKVTSSTVSFLWDTGFSVTERYLSIGTTAGGSQIYGGYQGTATSRTVTNIPQDGSTVYVTLSSWLSGAGAWAANNYTYIGGGNAPTPTPTPTTSPGASCVNAAGQTIVEPSNIVMQTMVAGGTNNYVFDGTQNSTSPQNTIQVFPLPKAWLDGAVLTGAGINFASYVNVNLAGAQYEVSFSKCKGDFSYYQTPQASVAYPGSTQVFYPCGLTAGADMNVGWSDMPSIYTCLIPANEQWYMNWRVKNCPTNLGHTCGQTFYLPRG